MLKLLFSTLLLTCMASAIAAGVVIQVPPGYRLQKLEATDGQIAIPENWFYSDGATANGAVWTFSKEDTKGGKGYETGKRIQLIAGVRKATGLSPQGFVQKFFMQKRESEKVLRECAPVDQGDFTRQCLEVEEEARSPQRGHYRIIYSAFWSRDADILVIDTFGAPSDQWKENEHHIAVMSHYQFMGPSFVAKLKAPN